VDACLVLDVRQDGEVGKDVVNAIDNFALGFEREVVIEVNDVVILNAGIGRQGVGDIPNGLRDAASAQIPIRQTQGFKTTQRFVHECIVTEFA
jgi:hypothetical protein